MPYFKGEYHQSKFFEFFSIFFETFQKFWLGGAAPRPSAFWLGGQIPPLNGRSQHLIEAAKQGRLDQMIFLIGAADDTGGADDTSQHSFWYTLFPVLSLKKRD